MIFSLDESKFTADKIFLLMIQKSLVVMLIFNIFICSKNARFKRCNFTLLLVRKNFDSMCSNRTVDCEV